MHLRKQLLGFFFSNFQDVQQIFLAKESCKHNSETDDLNSIALVKFLKEENEKLSACLHEEKIKIKCMENKCHQLIEVNITILKISAVPTFASQRG